MSIKNTHGVLRYANTPYKLMNSSVEGIMNPSTIDRRDHESDHK